MGNRGAYDPAGQARHSAVQVNIREVLGIFYVLSTGCQWSAVPEDLPPPRHHPPRAAETQDRQNHEKLFARTLIGVREF